MAVWINLDKRPFYKKGATMPCQCSPHWGWMVVLACFGVRIFVYGMTTTSGILYIIFLEEFEESKGATALIGSLITASGYFTGALAGSLVNRYGPRTVVILAGFIASTGLVASMFAESVLHLIITYGVVSGIGFGLCYVPISVAVVDYFDKHRNVAMAFSSCGGGLGRFLFPVFLRVLIDLLGWRGTLLICGGLSLNIVVFGALLRPCSKQCVEESGSGSVVEKGRRESGDQVCGRELKAQSKVMLSNMSIAMSQDLYFSSNSDISGDSLSGKLKHRVQSEKSLKNSKTIRCKPSDQERTIFHWDIFKNAEYCILCLNNFLYFIGLSIIYVHLFAFAKMHVGIDETRSALLFTLVGGMSLVGKLCLGTMAQHPKIKEIVIYILCIIIFGLATLFLPIKTSYATLVVYACVFGICDSTIGGAILPAVLVQYAGKERMSSSYGAVLVTEGVGHFIGAPIAGWLFETTMDYTTCFYLGGATILISGLVMIIPWKLMKRCRHGNQDGDGYDSGRDEDEIMEFKRHLKADDITECVVTTV